MRSALRAVGLGVLVALVAGCASIPVSGPVRQGAEVGTERTEPFIRIIARPPVPGMDPRDVVNGFLRASASFEDDHAVARDYLTPQAAESWRPDTQTVVYETSSELVPGNGVVRLRGKELATISQQGEYVASAEGQRIGVTFRMALVDGEWRISELPDGLFLTEPDVDRAFRTFDLYFPDPTLQVLVPNQVRLPVGSGLSTTLVRALLDGPTPWLAPAVHTAFPEGTALASGSAPVRNGVVQVDLTDQANQASAQQAAAMSAQLVWTLRQLSDVASVRITVAGQPFPPGSTESLQPRDAWSSWNPDVLSTSAPSYFVRRSRVYRGLGADAQALPGPFGDGRIPVRHPAVSLDGSQLAGLDASGRLVVGKIGPDEKVSIALTGASLTAPCWDVFGTVWTVDRTDEGPVVWAVAPGQQPVRVSTPNLPPGRVAALVVSRDGIRVALVVSDKSGSDLFVGRVERAGEQLTVAGFRPIQTTLAPIIDVAWGTADRLVVLGVGTGGATAPAIVDLSGVTVRNLGPVGKDDLVSVAAAPGQSVLGSTAGGQLYRDTGLGWAPAGEGTDPSYPG